MFVNHISFKCPSKSIQHLTNQTHPAFATRTKPLYKILALYVVFSNQVSNKPMMVLLKQVIQIHNQWRALFPICKVSKNQWEAETICNIGIICRLSCNANKKLLLNQL